MDRLSIDRLTFGNDALCIANLSSREPPPLESHQKKGRGSGPGTRTRWSLVRLKAEEAVRQIAFCG